MRRAEELKPTVRINVYNAAQGTNSGPIGLVGFCGAYHSGIEINGVEFSFGAGVGVYETRPGDYGEVIHSETFQSLITIGEIRRVTDRLRAEYQGNQYHIILKNCNSFSDALVYACTKGAQNLPSWVNRAAWWAAWFKPCFYMCGMSDAPNDEQPLLGQSTRDPPLQISMFAGEGVTLNGERNQNLNQLSVEEQRAIRLRNFGGN